jgi:hypothetical protein
MTSQNLGIAADVSVRNFSFRRRQPFVSCREILRRRGDGEIYEPLAAGVSNAVDRASRGAHNVAGPQPLRLADSRQERGAALFNEPYLFACRVDVSRRGGAWLHSDSRDRDSGLGRILGPHNLHRSKSGVLQRCRVCGRETLNGQDCRSLYLTAWSLAG